nr:MAG TPA: hypothetical protein [Bacteriophage sp.]
MTLCHSAASFCFRRRHAESCSLLRCGAADFGGSQQFNGVFFPHVPIRAN